MLPAPITSRGRRLSPRDPRHSRKRTVDFLFGRARLTNLAVTILVCITVLSLFLNLSHTFSSPYGGLNLYAVPESILSTIVRDPSIAGLSHLVVVPGHAIWTGSNGQQLDEDTWVLETYQKGGGRVSAFVNHIQVGAQLVSGDEDALLVFSGGQTRLKSTTTEAESYLRLALALDAFDTSQSGGRFTRATTENYALDSYQNLLFSIARFHEYTGRYPQKITVIGYEMKRRRFTELHRKALRWPESRFQYIGIDPQNESASNAEEGEMQNGYLPYTVDSYGCHTTLLEKRKLRNPFMRFHPYHTSAPEMRELLDWCPGQRQGGMKKEYSGLLPWDKFNA